MTICCLAVTGGNSIGKCGRLSQPSWLLVCSVHYNIVLIILLYIMRVPGLRQ